MVKRQLHYVVSKLSMMDHCFNFAHSSNIFHCRVGTALHSLGMCYHLQLKFAQAQTCYEVNFLFNFYSSLILLRNTDRGTDCRE
jgi:hypothetical protein